MTEEWKNILETKSRYSISNLGGIKNNKRNKIVSASKTPSGYLFSSLFLGSKNYYKRFPIHRLVAKYFVAGDSSLQVNHKDGNKSNNHFENLEWVTASQNVQHYWDGKKTREQAK